jgi:hypothetical protein
MTENKLDVGRKVKEDSDIHNNLDYVDAMFI